MGFIDSDGNALSGGGSVESTKVLGVIGDSISSDIETADYLAWVKPCVDLMGNPTLSRQTYGGARIYTNLIAYAAKISSDCDMVIVAMGRNDVQQSELGDVDTVMEMDLADCETAETTMARYRYALETLKNRLHDNAVIVCVSPISETLIDGPWATTTNETWKATYEAMVALRQAIRDFTVAEGGPAAGWCYINGREILSPDDADIYYKHNGVVNTTHPNKHGEQVMASYIFAHVPDINLIEEPE